MWHMWHRLAGVFLLRQPCRCKRGSRQSLWCVWCGAVRCGAVRCGAVRTVLVTSMAGGCWRVWSGGGSVLGAPGSLWYHMVCSREPAGLQGSAVMSQGSGAHVPMLGTVLGLWLVLISSAEMWFRHCDRMCRQMWSRYCCGWA